MKQQLVIALAFVTVFIKQAQTQNLIKYPGFESGKIESPWTTWAASNSSVKTSSEEANSGIHSVVLNGKETYLEQIVRVGPNSIYTISAFIKTENGEKVYLGAKEYGGEEISVLVSSEKFVKDSIKIRTGEYPADAVVYVWKDKGKGKVWLDDFYMRADSVGTNETPGGKGDYYVSADGNDENEGTSVDKPWKTIAKVNSIDFEPGDIIHFSGGEVFTGKLFFNSSDSGTEHKPIIITSFGKGRAIINAGKREGVYMDGSSYVQINNLKVVGDGRLNGNETDGVIISKCSHITIDSLDVSGFQHSGLVTKNGGKHYSFTHVYAHDNGYAGIFINGAFGDKFSLSDVYLGNCNVENNPGDPTVLDNHSGNGIFIFFACKVLVEYCKATNNGWDMPWDGNGPGGIWMAEADSVLIQYCVSHDNKTSKGAKDGLGFDIDGGTTNSVIQYCLSYNNYGSGYGIFQYPGASRFHNNIIRYCISKNDGNVSAKSSVDIWNGNKKPSDFSGLQFYNNVICNPNGAALGFLDHKNENFNFWNNVFVGKGELVYGGIENENFYGNCWYSLEGGFNITADKDFVKWVNISGKEQLGGKVVRVNSDPLFILPGSSGATGSIELNSLLGYKLKPELINSGQNLKELFQANPGKWDFYNNIPKGHSFDVSVYEQPGNMKSSLNIQYYSLSQEIRVYPNPVKDYTLNILLEKWPHNRRFTYSLIDLNGRTVEEAIKYNSGVPVTIRLKEYITPGYYFVEVLMEGGVSAISKPVWIK